MFILKIQTAFHCLLLRYNMIQNNISIIISGMTDLPLLTHPLEITNSFTKRGPESKKFVA